MKIGFTGTQRGMTDAQKVTLRSLLNQGNGEFHHGDCIGADAEAHDIAVGMGYEIDVHPPSDAKKRAWREGTRIHEPEPYLERNQSIVMSVDLMIATPGEDKEQVRSGTWATIRFSRQTGRKTIIILPDGTIKRNFNAA